MATLSTNYKDAVWSGQRKYNLVTNQDESVSLTDVTTYTVEGSYFGAADINATNTQVNGVSGSKTISIATSAWSNSTSTVNGNAYYVATVTGLTIYEENPQISISPAGTVPTTAEENAFSALAYAVANTTNGSITFYAYTKPSTAISVLAKGVS